MADQFKYTGYLKGRRVLVIGGSSGIGFAVAEAAVEHGCHVIISSSDQKRVDGKVAELKKLYPSQAEHIEGHACNLGDEANMESNLVSLLEACNAKLDHVVHTAGDALARMDIKSAELKDIKQAGMVRFFSALLLGKLAPKYMNPGPESSITLTTGSVSERPRPGWAVINSYATGLQGMCRGLALDLAPLRVNLVSPGAVDTELWANAGLDEQAKKALLDKTAAANPTGRIAMPGQVAETYMYLMKDSNNTGSMISTNSGALLVGPQ